MRQAEGLQCLCSVLYQQKISFRNFRFDVDKSVPAWYYTENLLKTGTENERKRIMDFALPLENKKISDSSLETKIREMLGENERELFRIVTDLLPCGNYGQSLAEFTDRRIIAAHREEDGNIVCDTVLYSEVESLTIKRMYGNAFLLAVKKSGEKRR